MSKIEPALTKEEWDVWREARSGTLDDGGSTVDAAIAVGDAHAIAAKLLYGQPFGFTREDVGQLRAVARDIGGHQGWDESDGEWVNEIADRIEALLPPEDIGEDERG